MTYKTYIVESCGRVLILAGNSQLAIGAFADRLSKKIRTIRQRQVNDPSFVCAHWLKRKRDAGLTNAIRSEIRHRL